MTGNTIRVLQILPGEEHLRVKCVLVHTLRCKDTHICLSYMWGDERDQKAISVNGKSFYVRQSLWEFLLIARRLKISSDLLWIDAICINQDSIKERNHQVQLMAQIYSLAKHVIIWPGHIVNSIWSALDELQPFDSSDTWATGCVVLKRKLKLINGA